MAASLPLSSTPNVPRKSRLFIYKTNKPTHISTTMTFLHLLTTLSLLTVAFSDDLQTLLSLKTTFQTSNTNNNLFNTWLPTPTNSFCNFSGVTCDSTGSQVQELDLSRQNLAGPVPLPDICKLGSLERLSLGFNNLNGEVKGLNGCVKLKYLDLGNNVFTGLFPEFGNLHGLVTLYANNSGFSGVFPWESLGNLSTIEVLSVGDNKFDRTVFPDVIVNLTSLSWLYMSNCSIEGEIPDGIGNLVELVNLEMSQNNLTGRIPVGISRLSKLWQLEIYENSLSGELPVGFGNLTSLENFDGSTNLLEGNLSEIRFLRNLKSLQLLQNRFSGEIPPELGEFRNLVNLSLYENQLTGSLPQRLGSWAEFDFIDVSTNFLTGPIPPDMCKQGTMKKLLMLENNFTGEIPGTYGNCSTLVRFRVNDNQLTGRVPSGLWGMLRMEIIDLSNNDLEGPVTSDIGKAKSLGKLLIANNRLSGQLPSEISEASSLVSIDLSNNRFSGEIPSSIGELDRLESLVLQGNMFSNSLPGSLSSCLSINAINLAHNSLTGQIPPSLGSLENLNFLNLSRNQLSGPIPLTLSSLRLNLLDLSENRLAGPIPVSLLAMANNGSFSGNTGLCSESVRGYQRCSRESGMSHNHLRTMLVCLMVATMVMVVYLGVFCFLKKKKKHDGERSLKEDSWDIKSFHVLTFTEDEILDSIKQENVIGKGGSGEVYRAVVGKDKELAVKHIWHSDSINGRKRIGGSTPMLSRRGSKSKEFEAEVQTLSSIRHINVVKLYCSITSEDSSLLVYEYMPNGSLWDRLHTCDKLSLDWETRYEIALGAARGLEYLHHGLDKPVIHRDVKSSNILLDEYLKPVIADFGLAKIVQSNPGKDSTQVIAGTHGYIAPEYGYTSKVNEKSDVYSFGVVLMELVTGKRPIEPEFGDNKDIVDWVCSRLKTKESVFNLVDSVIPEVYREDSIKVLKVAILCTAKVPTVRPAMRSVVHMLEEAQPPCNLVEIIVSKDGKIQESERKR